jgi:hypothetical protein
MCSSFSITLGNEKVSNWLNTMEDIGMLAVTVEIVQIALAFPVK